MLKHTVRKQSKRINRQDYWSDTIEGYDVVISQETDGPIRIFVDGYSIGVSSFELYPKNVVGLETLAGDAERLFHGIAAALRGIGKDDLRSTGEIAIEKNRKALEKFSA
jgi:hypothetical protein